MRATSKDESGEELGFWTRFGNALATIDMSSIDLLESRVERLEKQVALLTMAMERLGAGTSPTDHDD